jgi:Fungal tRNA ligase phosphodiesterase domain
MKKKIKEVLRESINIKKPILYSCVLLDMKSHSLLLSTFSDKIPNGWKTIAHHMTIVFGKGIEDKSELGKEATLTVTYIGWTDKAIAVLVDGYPSKNANPHVTLAVNPDGGKPQMSNDITNWQKVKPFTITGVVTEI